MKKLKTYAAARYSVTGNSFAAFFGVVAFFAIAFFKSFKFHCKLNLLISEIIYLRSASEGDKA